MNNEIQQFNFQGQHTIRTIAIDGEPWFVAADIIAILDLDRKALERLDDDERGVSSIHTPSKNQHGEFGTVPQNMTIINESGLYSLILGSRKPEAKKIQKWVTSEVLPSIRKTGGYTLNPNTPLALPSGKPAQPPIGNADFLYWFWQQYAAINAVTPINHSDNDDWIAIDIHEFVNACKLLRNTDITTSHIYQNLPRCGHPHPEFTGISRIKSAIRHRKTKCWLFNRTPPNPYPSIY